MSALSQKWLRLGMPWSHHLPADCPVLECTQSVGQEGAWAGDQRGQLGRLRPLQQTAGPEQQQVLGCSKLQCDVLIGPNKEHSAALQGDGCLGCGQADCHCPLHHQEDAGRVQRQDLIFSDRARNLCRKVQPRLGSRLGMISRAVRDSSVTSSPPFRLLSAWKPHLLLAQTRRA